MSLALSFTFSIIFYVSLVHNPVASQGGQNFLKLSLLSSQKDTTEKELNGTNAFNQYCSYDTIRGDCPRDLNLAWLNQPPLVHGMLRNGTNTTKILRGIFVDVLESAFRICCFPCQTKVSYHEKASQNFSELHEHIFTANAHVIMPVSTVPSLLPFGNYYGGVLPYVEVLTSPGLMLITNKEQVAQLGRQQVWNALAGTWPVLLPSMLLVIIAGILVWALEHPRNHDEFPKQFLHGAANGIWWSFVSMTTVGYGDKSPKSLFGRVFGMVWIIFGLVICAFIVATLESALTITSMEKPAKLFGKKIAVINNSRAYEEAVNQGAKTKVYSSFQAAYNALVISQDIHGILEDVPFGVFHMQEINDKRLVVARVFERPHSYGIAVVEHFPKSKVQCLSEVFRFRSKDVASTLDGYYSLMLEAQTSANSEEEKEAVISLLDNRSSFYYMLLYVLIILLGIMMVGGVVHQFVFTAGRCRRRRTVNREVELEKQEAGTIKT